MCNYSLKINLETRGGIKFKRHSDAYVSFGGREKKIKEKDQIDVGF